MEQSPQVNTTFAAPGERFDPTALAFPECQISPNLAPNGETKIHAHGTAFFWGRPDRRLSREIPLRRPDPTPV